MECNHGSHYAIGMCINCYSIFAEEWHHMTRRVGLPEQAAIYRLSDAFKLSEATITRYVQRYKHEQLVAA